MTGAEPNEETALGRWAPIESRLRALEETYRVERIRKNGRPYPVGESLRQLEADLHSVCELYMETTAEHRAAMRGLFGWSYMIPRYLERCVKIPEVIVDRASAVKSLRIALAAASLCCPDIRDLYIGLGQAWAMFEKAGIDPRPWLLEAAGWLSGDNVPYCNSMRRFFLGFEDSAYFHESVLPRLRENRGRSRSAKCER